MTAEPPHFILLVDNPFVGLAALLYSVAIAPYVIARNAVIGRLHGRAVGWFVASACLVAGLSWALGVVVLTAAVFLLPDSAA